MTEIPLDLLPRLCPLCGERTIIGHGQRLKQAHDQRHQQIWIRRGRCRPCHKTFTVLPDWSPPSGHYSLHCRQQAWELLRQARWHLGAIRSRRRRCVAVARPIYGETVGGTLAASGNPAGDEALAGHRLEHSRRRPPSLPGIGPRSAVFCRWRRAVRESARHSMNSNSRFPYWTTWKHTIGGRSGDSAAADGWGCARCTTITSPSFLMDPSKNLFYCYGCGRGGDVIRFAETLSPGEVSASPGVAAPMAWLERLYCTKPPVSIACSYTVTARRLPICTNADSARRN